jgi:hypothetical protein
MSQNNLLIGIAMLLSLICGNEIQAQSKLRQNSESLVAPQATFLSESIELDTPTATLYSTLLRPRRSSRVPVVIII